MAVNLRVYEIAKANTKTSPLCGSNKRQQQQEAAATEASVMELELLPKIATTFGWLASVACHMCCCCKDCWHCHCCCNWGRRRPWRHRRICVDNIPNSIREKNIQQLLRCGNRAIERERERKRREGEGRKGEEAAQLQLLRICCKSRPGRHVASCALNADDDDDALLLPLLLLLAACPIQAE